MNTASVSLADLNLSAQCEEGVEFEYIDPAGKRTGVFASVIGAQAPAVQHWLSAELNARRRQAALSDKRGGDVPARTVEEDKEFNAQYVAIRLISWRGISDPFTFENAVKLCASNILFAEQARSTSEQLENFTSRK